MLTFRNRKQKLTPLRILVIAVLFMSWMLLLGPAHAQAASGQFILKLKNSVELSNAPTLRRLEKEGEFLGSVLSRNNLDASWVRAGSVGTHVMRWGSAVRASDQQALLNRLASDPEVEFAIADRPVRAFAAPNDSLFLNQWALRSVSQTAGAKFDQAWDLIRGSADVVVAVLDTGVVFETPDLAGRLLSGYDFVSDIPTANDGNGRDSNAADPGNWVSTADTQTAAFSGCSVKDSSWHGTFVSGQIAANTNNDSGVAGADWNVKVLPVRVLGKCGGLLSDVLDGMLWAAGLGVPGIPRNNAPADVINLSLGSVSTCSSLEQTVVDRVNAAGTLVVAAAGNSGGAVDSPANCTNVLAVGALDRDGSRAAYSAIGGDISLMAPGGFSNSLVGLGNSGNTTPDSAVPVSKTGTSFASPLVAATAGLMRAVNPALTPAQLRSQILANTSSFLAPRSSTCVVGSGSSCNCTTAVCGTGMLNAFAAVAAVRETRPLANATVSANGLNGLNPVRLRGSASTVASGRTVASYSWAQFGGEQLMSTPQTTADVDLPAASSTSDLLFRLTVTDSVGDSHSSFTSIRVMASGENDSSPSSTASAGTTPTSAPTSGTSSSAPIASAGGGGGGGSLSLAGLLGLVLLLAAFSRSGHALRS